MPCNCKNNQRLLELGMKYGMKGKTRKEIIKQKTGNAFRSVIGIILAVLASPFILIGLLFKAIFSKDKGVHFEKIFNLKKNAGKQQVIQD